MVLNPRKHHLTRTHCAFTAQAHGAIMAQEGRATHNRLHTRRSLFCGQTLTLSSTCHPAASVAAQIKQSSTPGSQYLFEIAVASAPDI
ncbi:hypothetical protein ACKKBG_A19485 [Auxenochlorella protothecoides x Auxenochlorella symbiontica]